MSQQNRGSGLSLRHGVLISDMSPLISEKHRNLYKRHYEIKACVAYPQPWNRLVADLVQIESATSILDYGCGPGRGLSKFLDMPVVDYDPAVSGIDTAPKAKFDIVVVNHVLDNVEIACLDNVLEHLFELTRKVLFVSVNCNPSTKQFADGSPVPRIMQKSEWWLAKLKSLFVSIEILDHKNSDLELIILARNMAC